MCKIYFCDTFTPRTSAAPWSMLSGSAVAAALQC